MIRLMLNFKLLVEVIKIMKEIIQHYYFLKMLLKYSNISTISLQFSSVAQLCPTLCNPMDTRPPCPSPTPGVYSNSCPLGQWCHPTVSSSVITFSSYLQSFPGSGSFQMSQFFTSHGLSIGDSALASVLPMNIQDWFLLVLVESPCSPRGSWESSLTPEIKSINSHYYRYANQNHNEISPHTG